MELLTTLSVNDQESVIIRDLRKIRANPEYFLKTLREVKWACLANIIWDVDEMEKFWTASIKQCLDKVAPLKEIKLKPKKYRLPKDVQDEVKRRNDLYHELTVAKKTMEEHERIHTNEKIRRMSVA